MENTRLSKHFTLEEFINTQKYPCNKPTLQHVANMVYGCVMLLEPARQVVGPILVNSGFRNEDVNRHVGGVKNSQHLTGQLKNSEYTDQLLTGNGWLHISWSPFSTPRHYVRIGYYK